MACQSASPLRVENREFLLTADLGAHFAWTGHAGRKAGRQPACEVVPVFRAGG